MDKNEMLKIVRDYLTVRLGESTTVSLNDDSSLIESRLLDSINTLQLVAFIEEKFSVEVGAHEITNENLDSVNKIVEFVLSKK